MYSTSLWKHNFTALPSRFRRNKEKATKRRLLRRQGEIDHYASAVKEIMGRKKKKKKMHPVQHQRVNASKMRRQTSGQGKNGPIVSEKAGGARKIEQESSIQASLCGHRYSLSASPDHITHTHTQISFRLLLLLLWASAQPIIFIGEKGGWTTD